MTKNGKKSNVLSIESIPPPPLVFLSVCYCYLYISVVEHSLHIVFRFFQENE